MYVTEITCPRHPELELHVAFPNTVVSYTRLAKTKWKPSQTNLTLKNILLNSSEFISRCERSKLTCHKDCASKNCYTTLMVSLIHYSTQFVHLKITMPHRIFISYIMSHIFFISKLSCFIDCLCQHSQDTQKVHRIHYATQIVHLKISMSRRWFISTLSCHKDCSPQQCNATKIVHIITIMLHRWFIY